MNRLLELTVNKNALEAYGKKKFTLGTTIAMLAARTLLFLIFQMCFYVLFLLLGARDPFLRAAKYWPFVMVFTNIVCVLLLTRLLRREGSRYLDFFQFHKGTVRKDALVAVGLLLIVAPIGFFPNILLANWLIGGYEKANALFCQPIPMWAAVSALVLFPLSMPFGEMTTYLGYVMPRLEISLKNRALSVVLTSLLFSVQHAALPLLFAFSGMFILWRAFMFLPFALMLALIVRWRPRLFPYLLISHFLMDMGTAVMLLLASVPK